MSLPRVRTAAAAVLRATVRSSSGSSGSAACWRAISTRAAAGGALRASAGSIARLSTALPTATARSLPRLATAPVRRALSTEVSEQPTIGVEEVCCGSGCAVVLAYTAASRKRHVSVSNPWCEACASSEPRLPSPTASLIQAVSISETMLQQIENDRTTFAKALDAVSRHADASIMDKWQAAVQVLLSCQVHAILPFGFTADEAGLRAYNEQLHQLMEKSADTDGTKQLHKLNNVGKGGAAQISSSPARSSNTHFSPGRTAGE